MGTSKLKRIAKKTMPSNMQLEAKCILAYLMQSMIGHFTGYVMLPIESNRIKLDRFYTDFAKGLNIDDATYLRIITPFYQNGNLAERLGSKIKTSEEREYCRYCIIETAFLISECEEYSSTLFEEIEKSLCNDVLPYL